MPTNKPEVVLPKPKFGEWLRGVYASERNPHRDGMYVRTILRDGRFNPGKYYELTDGEGDFWTYLAESTERISPADTLTRPADGVTAGDAVFAFSALLTALPHVVPFGAAAWATPGADLAEAFNEANGLTVSLDFPQGLVFPKIEGELLDRVKQASTQSAAMLSAAPQQPGQEVVFQCPECGTGMEVDPTAKPSSTQSQQPAEAVAVPVAFVPVHPRNGPLWTETYPRGSEAAERLPHYERMPMFFEPPPAIDIGKLRQIAAELRDNAHHHRQEDREVGMLADEQEAQFNEELAERIEAALIGDGGEKGNV